MSLYRNFIVNCIILEFASNADVIKCKRALYAKFGSINLAKLILIFDNIMVISLPSSMFMVNGTTRYITDDDINMGYRDLNSIKHLIKNDVDNNTNMRRDQALNMIMKICIYATNHNITTRPLKWRVVETTSDTTDINSDTQYNLGTILDFGYVTPKVDAILLRRMLNYN